MIKMRNLLESDKQYNAVIVTNQGTFQVRYATERDGKKFLVIGKNQNTGKYADGFDGDYGDEIEFSKTGLKKYDAKLPKTFRI